MPVASGLGGKIDLRVDQPPGPSSVYGHERVCSDRYLITVDSQTFRFDVGQVMCCLTDQFRFDWNDPPLLGREHGVDWD